jgi:hypothetical protein
MRERETHSSSIEHELEAACIVLADSSTCFVSGSPTSSAYWARLELESPIFFASFLRYFFLYLSSSLQNISSNSFDSSPTYAYELFLYTANISHADTCHTLIQDLQCLLRGRSPTRNRLRERLHSRETNGHASKISSKSFISRRAGP